MSDLLVPQEDPTLHTKAREVPKNMFGSEELNTIISTMREGLHSYHVEGFVGVAIAAPQVGISYRIFLVDDLSPHREGEEKLPSIVAINPKIIKRSREKNVVGEGCLSVPHHYGAVERAQNVTLEAYDEQGKKFTRGAGGFLAQVFQHECDHLEGTLFIDVAKKYWHKDEMNDRRNPSL